MRQLFISDLHLSPDRPDLIRLATAFLLEQTDIDRLYILGDIFNTWLGDDLLLPEYQPFTDALKQLRQQGTQLFLMVGNRDFMLGKDFAASVGAKLLADPVVHYFDEIPVLLMHGDSLCTDDISYQRYRRVVRNRFLQWCFLQLPIKIRQSISDQIKAKSRTQKQQKTVSIMDVNQATVAETLSRHHVPVLIHGHTHRPAIHQVNIADKRCQRIVLGDWHDAPSFLTVDNGQFELVDPRLPAGSLQLNLKL